MYKYPLPRFHKNILDILRRGRKENLNTDLIYIRYTAGGTEASLVFIGKC